MTNKLGIIVTGANGRMGKTIIGLVSEDEQAQLVGATEYDGSPVIGEDAGINAGVPSQDVAIVAELDGALQKGKGVIIDFSSLEGTLENLKIAVSHQVPIVIGTTGFNDTQKKEIEQASQKIPVILSPNMSVGVNVMFKLVADAAKILGDAYDIEVLEIHHKHKKDAPSGTAMKIAEVLCEATDRNASKDLNYHREGETGERDPKDIGMQTLRGGDVVGEHTVFYCGQGERIEIKHTATSRATFAAGSIRAAKWLNGKEAGIYNMRDVLGF